MANKTSTDINRQIKLLDQKRRENEMLERQMLERMEAEREKQNRINERQLRENEKTISKMNAAADRLEKANNEQRYLNWYSKLSPEEQILEDKRRNEEKKRELEKQYLESKQYYEGVSRRAVIRFEKEKEENIFIINQKISILKKKHLKLLWLFTIFPFIDLVVFMIYGFKISNMNDQSQMKDAIINCCIVLAVIIFIGILLTICFVLLAKKSNKKKIDSLYNDISLEKNREYEEYYYVKDAKKELEKREQAFKNFTHDSFKRI